jgi:hypothetical protein
VEQEGTTAIFVDKLPIFDDGRITPGVQLPIDLEVPCEVRCWHTDHGVRRWAVISLLGRPGGLEDQAGRTEFRVPADEIITRP